MLRGERCLTTKCPLERREGRPGMHGPRRGKVSDYGRRLREKQKVKQYYGVFDRQFMRYFARAQKGTGNTGATLLGLLERRLDNVVWKLGLAPSHSAARQWIVHGHFHVNGRKVNVPSYSCRVGDRIAVKDSDRSRKLLRTYLEEAGEPRPQNWLRVDVPKLEGQVVALPTREDVQVPVEENLIVELCSR
jgi:small subunit ribosomal protein S4